MPRPSCFHPSPETLPRVPEAKPDGFLKTSLFSGSRENSTTEAFARLLLPKEYERVERIRKMKRERILRERAVAAAVPLPGLQEGSDALEEFNQALEAATGDRVASRTPSAQDEPAADDNAAGGGATGEGDGPGDDPSDPDQDDPGDGDPGPGGNDQPSPGAPAEPAAAPSPSDGAAPTTDNPPPGAAAGDPPPAPSPVPSPAPSPSKKPTPPPAETSVTLIQPQSHGNLQPTQHPLSDLAPWLTEIRGAQTWHWNLAPQLQHPPPQPIQVNIMHNYAPIYYLPHSEEYAYGGQLELAYGVRHHYYADYPPAYYY